MNEGYYEKLCRLQKELIEQYHQFLHSINKPGSLDSASSREWSLATRCAFLEKDNKALRELCEEYREVLHGETD